MWLYCLRFKFFDLWLTRQFWEVTTLQLWFRLLSNELQIFYNFISLFQRTFSFIIVVANVIKVRRLFKSKQVMNKISENYLFRKEYAFVLSLTANNFILFVLVTPFFAFDLYNWTVFCRPVFQAPTFLMLVYY